MISILRGININKRKKRRLYPSSLRLLLSIPIFSNFSFQKNKRKKTKVALFLTPPSQTSPYPECQTINLYCDIFPGQVWEIGNCFASAAWKMKEILVVPVMLHPVGSLTTTSPVLALGVPRVRGYGLLNWPGEQVLGVVHPAEMWNEPNA